MRSALLILMACALAGAQDRPAKRSFEVTSIRPADPDLADNPFIGMSADPGFVTYRNTTLLDAIRGAYKIGNYQIVGPDWIPTARFDIAAKLPAGATHEQIPEMFQALLEDRFKITFRRELKEMDVYSLQVAKDGPKLKPAKPVPSTQLLAMGTDGKPRPAVVFGGSLSSMTITAPSASILTLVGIMSRFTLRPVIDDTAIEGNYDFTLTFAAETGAGLPRGFEGNKSTEPAPPLSEAVKTYGLRIQPRKAIVDLFVVTHIE